MNLSEILLSIVAGAATLTPLTLGLLNYFGDKRKDSAPVKAVVEAAPAPVVGEAVDFESLAVRALNAHIALLTESHNDMRDRLRQADRDRQMQEANLARADAEKQAAAAQRDAAYDRLRDAGLRP